MSEDILTYNYYCLYDDCDNNKMIHITLPIADEDKPQYCSHCTNTLKMVGIHTSIVHKGTQESKT